MRKLNMKFARDMGKAGGAAALAYLYEEIAANAVVEATAGDGRFSLFDVALQIGVGLGPYALAGHLRGPFWAAFAGAVTFNRIDNVMVVLGGRPAMTHMGAVMPGETLQQAQERLQGVSRVQ